MTFSSWIQFHKLNWKLHFNKKWVNHVIEEIPQGLEEKAGIFGQNIQKKFFLSNYKYIYIGVEEGKEKGSHVIKCKHDSVNTIAPLWSPSQE